MGNLITETPYSEITATMELFDLLGVGREDLKRFRKSSTREQVEVAKLIKGQGAMVIDCDAQPSVPDDWSVEEHQKGGAFTWDKETQKNALYLSKGQAGSSYIVGNMLRKELKNKSTPVLNANVLDYLLKNPYLIPLEWKGTYVFFWGTIYRDRGGRLYVRCLCWSGGRWGWAAAGSICDFHGNFPAAVRAT
jgi:hypothetical protein